ncbi:SusC/RagA family TonB-linked outer membrane protein [Mangrovibacterium sp.]|uniref:SusC/RagA family TonB-linked outer membrane protein n=1 Tax=Mangrovibacterium sp. TaxID=1961364 RepID=UPI00356334A9
MKKKLNLARYDSRHVRKLFLLMKLTTFFILVMTLHLSASVYSQQKQLSLDLNNVRIREVLNAIESQSNFKFLLQDERINIDQKISINVDQANIDAILDKIFAENSVDVTITDKDLIIIRPSNNQYSNTNNQQQQKVVKGKITDEDGQPLPGVTIVIKGTTTGTISDFDGNYSIANVPETATLVFSFVGMGAQEMPVAGKNSINAVMKADAIGVDEVVVVGYGTQSKATLTGAVTQVKGDDIMKGKSTSNAILAMQGEVNGVLVTRGNARPGNEEMDIKIRGDMSVNDISPVIIVDGLEIPEWQLSTINSNDIETYSVLKDGAAAIYGTKAAGGVILITTKNGQKGKLKVDYQSDYQMNFAYDLPIANFSDWAQIWYNAGTNDMIDYVDSKGVTNTAGFTGRFFTQDEFYSIANGTFPLAPESYYFAGLDHRFADIDMYDYCYGTTGSHRHNVSVSGGSDKATFRTSLGYSDERSTLTEAYDGAKKYNFSTKVTYELSDMISTEFNIGYDVRNIDEPTQGIGEGLQNPPMFPIYNQYGQYYGLWGNNIPAKLTEGGRTVTEQESIRLGGKIKLDLDKYLKGFSLQYQANITKRRSDKTARKTQVTLYDWDGNVYNVSPSADATSVEVDLDKVFFQNHVVQANYQRKFGAHNLGVMVGAVSELSDTENYNMYRSGMSSNNLDALNTGDASTQTNEGESSAVGQVSYISRINYDYNGIYLLEGSLRRDGSSRLDPDYRWKNFYAASAGVRLSEMNFLKDRIFDNLKLRFSYGEMGSTTGIGTYDYISTISTGAEYFGTTPALQNTAWVSSMTSTDRSWERVAKTNVAVDFAVLDSRLSGTLEYFYNQNKDMLISVTYPEVLGATAPKTNSGDFVNKGWEVELKWRDKIGEVDYNVGLSMWDSKGEVTRMEGAESITYGINSSAIEGKPLNAIYTYKTDGLLQNEDEVLAYYNEVGFADPSDITTLVSGTKLPSYVSANRLIPGSVRRVDVSGDDKITTDDLVYYGDANPHYSFGINLGARWKNFDFSAFFQGVGQQHIVRGGTLAYPFRSWWMGQNETWLNKTWTPENTSSELPIVGYNGSRKTWNYAETNDINVVNASYLRAKVITFGYTFPKAWMYKAGVDKLRLSVTGNDLFCISNVKDGLDPEHGKDAHNGDALSFQSALIFSIQATF